MCSNQIYFLRPGQVHEFRPNKGAQFYFIAFDKDDVLMHAPTQLNQFEFFQSFHLTGPVVMDEVDSIIEDMVRIQTELNQPAQLQDMLISSLVTVLLIKIKRKFSVYSNDRGVRSVPEFVRLFNQMIDDSSIMYRFVKEYAADLHVSSTYLNDTVREYTGHSASFWINKKLITMSKHLLSDSSLNLKSIASQLGYSDPTHFTRFFKHHVQQTPREYRRVLVHS